jgi:FKBP-type peptidyl-prolyl cis-trans isomerase SlyD
MPKEIEAMRKITHNSLVSVSLLTHDDQNNLLEEREEIIYLHGGYGQIFATLEAVLEGAVVGDKFEVSLSIEEAFGAYDETLTVWESREDFEEDIAVGAEFEVEGEEAIWVVEEVEEDRLLLNANHPLAGIPLVLSGEVLEIQQLSAQEAERILALEHGH